MVRAMILLAAACWSDVPTTPAPPPPQVELEARVRGLPSTISASGLPDGFDVLVGVSTTGSARGPCLPGTAHCLDIDAQLPLAGPSQVQAGEVQVELQLPDAAVVWVQAIMMRGSDVRRSRIRRIALSAPEYVDRDGDGWTDAEELALGTDYRTPEGIERCDDAVDNDGDGLINCEDVDCMGHSACEEIDCDNGVDDDDDGDLDCADLDCVASCPDATARVRSGRWTLDHDKIIYRYPPNYILRDESVGRWQFMDLVGTVVGPGGSTVCTWRADTLSVFGAQYSGSSTTVVGPPGNLTVSPGCALPPSTIPLADLAWPNQPRSTPPGLATRGAPGWLNTVRTASTLSHTSRRQTIYGVVYGTELHTWQLNASGTLRPGEAATAN